MKFRFHGLFLSFLMVENESPRVDSGWQTCHRARLGGGIVDPAQLFWEVCFEFVKLHDWIKDCHEY